MTEDRRFPKPWAVQESGESFQVIDATGFPICYIYFEDEPVRASTAKRMNKKQALQMATQMAKLGQ